MQPKRKSRKPLDRRLLMLVGIVVIILIVALASTFPFGPDWRDVYHRAARDLVAGRNPHETTQPRFLNPTWLLIPLVPLGIMPVEWGGAIFFLISIASFAYTAYKLGASPVAMSAFVFSPPVLHCLLNGNIDWIPLLGVTMPPQIGLFLVTAKPQIGLTVALFWLVEAWRKGGWRETLRVFAPVSVAFLITFALFGFWPSKWLEQPEQWWNASLFPWSVPFGVYWMIQALRKREIKYALPAGPALSPYVIFHTWSAALVAVVKWDRWIIFLSAALWVLILVRAAAPNLW
jgi:hypothetical protein